MTPKTITVHMMYRDACNFKNCDFFVFTNNTGLDDEFIADKLSALEGDGIISTYYSIPNMAPFDNEFISTPGDDHSYTEYYELEFDTHTEDDHGDEPDTDISEVIAAIDDEDIVKQRRKNAYDEAVEHLEKELKQLKELQL